MGTTTTKKKTTIHVSDFTTRVHHKKKKKQYRDHTSNGTQQQNKTNKASWTPSTQHKYTILSAQLNRQQTPHKHTKL